MMNIRPRRDSKWLLSLLLCLTLPAFSGCNPVTGGGVKDVGAPSATAPGENIGSGSVKIGLVVPLTGPSGPSSVGSSLRDAAKLAYADSGANDVTILVKDDHSTASGAAAAAQAAIAEGAEILIGPVFASDVKEASRVARSSGRPIIAFSTDSSTAGNGTYLLSFLVDGYVERGMEYAATRGKKSVAALVPENEYGSLAMAQFQQSAA
ncbi:MAG: penicillin-binding protein activator, partial [Alphaproteobacteria bacterium]|nr:penicillin-binding protein activator [Alphaproteobacteria bacterium]